jgi:hypothetical protein
MKKAIAHLQKAQTALAAGDHKAGRFHIGHALAATRIAPMSEESDPNEPEPDNDQDDTMSSGNWISGAIKHPGALHKELGVPQGKKIPAKKLTAAAHSDNPTLRRRANLAKTLKHLNKKGK